MHVKCIGYPYIFLIKSHKERREQIPQASFVYRGLYMQRHKHMSRRQKKVIKYIRIIQEICLRDKRLEPRWNVTKEGLPW